MLAPEEQSRKITPAQWSVVALIVAVSAGSILYKVLIHEQLGHSAAMFIGIPLILAILLAIAPKAQTVTGGILKGITLALLIVAPLLGEGYLCILIASPLFYIVGIVIGLVADWDRKKRRATLSCATLVLLPMCLEGVVPELTFNRTQTIQVSKIVAVSPATVEQNLSQPPNINLPLPRFLNIGFPAPLQAQGSGLAIGDTRTIHFAGAEGDPPGDLILRVAERRSNYLRFEAVSDTSKLTQWVSWKNSEVEWTPIDATHTQVIWRIHFERQLDPAWYFTPWEQFAVREAAQYLITASTENPR